MAKRLSAKLRLADLLKAGPRTAEDLSTAAGVQAPALYRVLRALASVGVFADTKGRRFKLTPLAATLQTGGPASMHGWALMINEKHLGRLGGAPSWSEDRRDAVPQGPRCSALRVSRETPRGPRGLRRIDDQPLQDREPNDCGRV